MTLFLLLSLLLLVSASVFVVPTLWRVSNGEAAASAPQRGLAMGVLTALILATGGIYALVGNPMAIDQPAPDRPSANDESQEASTESAPQIGQAQIEAMVNRLAQRLQNQPDDLEGWRKLVRSYETLGRFPEAVDAYQHLMKLQTPDADLLTDYAVVLGMTQGRTLVGEPEAIIQRALKLNPHHAQALALAGSAALEKQDYAGAIAWWQTLLDRLPADSPMRESIQDNVNKARALAQKDHTTRP